MIEKANLTFDTIPLTSQFNSHQNREDLKTLMTQTLKGVRYTHTLLERRLFESLNTHHQSQFSSIYHCYYELFQWFLKHVPQTP
jgi:hypothetical protein